MQILARANLCLVALALLLTTGCASKRYRMGFELPAGQEAELLVLGSQLEITVDNEGPGQVLVIFDAPAEAGDEEVELATGSIMRSMPGPVRLRCVAGSERATTVEVRAKGANGMSLDQRPPPRTP